jgi:NADH-quinone oxidoreductase subunit C
MENKLNNEKVLEALEIRFGNLVLKSDDAQDNLLNVFLPSDKIHETIKWLYNHEDFKIQFLTNITCVHYPNNEKDKEFVVVYHLHSLQNNFRLRLKSYLPIEKPYIKSITDIFSAANWIERETFDFFGVIFENHPNLKRILNEETMEYHPLRKEYQLEDSIRQDKDDRYFGR